MSISNVIYLNNLAGGTSDIFDQPKYEIIPETTPINYKNITN